MVTELSIRHDIPSLTGARRERNHLVAAYEDSDYVLRSILTILDLTPYKLTRLIGKGTSNSYSWFSMPKTPSHAYWVRIAHLQTLALQGVNLNRVRTIDWSKPPYKIEWWPGAEPTEEELAAKEKQSDSRNRPKGDDAVRDAWRDIPTA